MDRRNLLKALVAAPAVGVSLPAVAEEHSREAKQIEAAIQQIYHPFLPIQRLDHSQGLVFALHYTKEFWEPPAHPIFEQIGSTNQFREIPRAERIMFKIVRHVVTDELPAYERINEVEDLILGEVRENCDRPRADMGLSIHRCISVGNRIAMESRRGPGNVMLVHEADIPALQELAKSRGLPWHRAPGQGLRFGRWQQAGYVGGLFEVWAQNTTTAVRPTGEAIIAYRGNTFDFPLIVASTPEGFKVHRLGGDPSIRQMPLTAYMKVVPIKEMAA